MFLKNIFSSILQIPGDSTLRKNFHQIQEGEGRRTPNPFYQPPAPLKGAHNHRLHHPDNGGIGVLNNNELNDSSSSSDLDYHPPHDGRFHAQPPTESHWVRRVEPSHHDALRHVESSCDEFVDPAAHVQSAQQKTYNHHELDAVPNQQKNRLSGSKRFTEHSLRHLCPEIDCSSNVY